MCECIVQPVSSPDFSGLLAQKENGSASSRLSALNQSLHLATDFAPHKKTSVIKPNMQIRAIRQRDGELECVKVRWGWSPVWTMGTLPPRTHLPLHLVMRSRAFDRIRSGGRVLVAVDGWYDVPTDHPSPHSRRLSYTTSRESTPIFLAALAQISEPSSGCDGLVLMTHGDTSNPQQRLLAFDADAALQWLKPELCWEQAQHMALHMAVNEPQLEHVLTAQRMF
ncbi:hypothetical protein ALP40_02213 [Pseudomonas viridiflava]|uniref:SOS response-associated peptidase YedK n=1 Tax=Pseudomonas viridiflava TaxID=33069 RepID=A0A3M5PHY0_PSEVI|nr:hypothetical protein ALP40_02213 [Pseudomonas viridiflava]